MSVTVRVDMKVVGQDMKSRHQSTGCPRQRAMGMLIASVLLILPACTEQRLLPGTPIESLLVAGDQHGYRIVVPAEHFLHLVVEQHGADLEVELVGAPEQDLARHDCIDEDRAGEEHLYLISRAAAVCSLRITSPEMTSGEPVEDPYRVSLQELRPVVPEDRQRLQAEQRTSEGDRLRQLAEDRDDMQVVIRHYREALPLWRSAGSAQGEIRALSGLARSHFLLKEYRQALTLYEEALAPARQIGAGSLEAKILLKIGHTYRGMREAEQALHCFEEAARIATVVGDRELEALILNDTGVFYYRSDRFERAVELLERSVRLTPERRRSHGTRLGNLAMVYEKLGELQRALDCQDRSYRHMLTSGNPKELARAYNNLASTYSALGLFEPALERLKQALELNRSIGDHTKEAQTLNNIGWVRQSMDSHREALEACTRALELLGEYPDPGVEARVLTNIGRSLRVLGEPQQAMIHLERALELRRRLSDRRGEAVTLLEMAKIRVDSGEVKAALEIAGRASGLCREIGDRYTGTMVLRAQAAALRRRGDMDLALERIEEAIGTIEALRGATADLEHRASFIASKRTFYEQWIDLLMELHQQRPDVAYDARAFQASERARARSLVDMLEEAQVAPGIKAPAELLQEERNLRGRLLKLESKRIKRANTDSSPDALDEVRREITIVAAQHQTVISQARALDPRYRDLTEPQVAELPKVQQEMLDNDTVLLEYSLGPQRSFLWVVTPAALHSFELPPRAEIEDLARHAHALVCARQVYHHGETGATRDRRIASADAEFVGIGAALTELLLEPAAPLLVDKRLAIVVDGALAWVPFAALPAPGSPGGRNPLVLEHEIVVLPSVSVLALLRQSADRPAATKTLLLIADPVFTRDDPRLPASGIRQRVVQATAHSGPATDEGDSLLGPPLRRLRFSEVEAERIAEFVRPEEAVLALGLEASPEMVLSGRLEDFRLIHFSTHGRLNSTYPQLSALELSRFDEHGNGIDGALRLQDIYRLELNADLVVLSACRTALGREIRGEGLVGLTRGFMYAGSARVLASLWMVEDRSTTELMVRFYRHLLEDGKCPAAALRAAQMSMLAEPKLEQPYYWAAFVLQGDWR